MKINPAPLHNAQSVSFGIVAVLATAITGTASHTLDVFHKQQPSNPWWLPLWPQHFDTNGTKALIGSAVSVLVLSIVFLVFAVVPRFNLTNRPTFRAMLSLGTCLPGALVTLITIIYAHILNNDSPHMDTLQTWTCRYRKSRPLEQNMPMPSNMGNSKFNSLCRESKFALYGTLIVFLLLSLNLGLTIVTWLADKWAARQNRKEVEMSPAQS